MAKRRWRTVYADERVIERSLYWRRLVSKSLIAIVCEFNRKLVLGGGREAVPRNGVAGRGREGGCCCTNETRNAAVTRTRLYDNVATAASALSRRVIFDLPRSFVLSAVVNRPGGQWPA